MTPAPMWFAIFLVVASLGGLAFWAASRRAFRSKITGELAYRLFLVELPRAEQGETRVTDEVQKSEQLVSTLASLKQPFAFEVAVPAVGEQIHFYAAVPDVSADLFTRQVHALWADARVTPADEYTVFNYAGAVAALTLRLAEPYPLPIRTYRELDADTFTSVLGGLAKLSEVGEGGAIQYVVAPAGKQEVKRVEKALALVQQGKKLSDALRAHELGLSAKDLHSAVTAGTKKAADPGERVVDAAAVRALEAKRSKPLFAVNVRVVASAPSQEQADTLLEGIAAGFSQFGAPDRNSFVAVRPRSLKGLTSSFIFREFDASAAITLNSEELASIFHLPTPFTDIPRVRRAAFVEAPPPPNLPKEGIVLGETRYRGTSQLVRLGREDRRRHLYIIGQTGTGKSVTLNNLAGQDIASGEGVCLIDPNGDFFQDSLTRVPRERVQNLIIFDPTDLERPLGLNMLEYDPKFPEHKTFIVNELLNIFDTLYDLKTTGGPMFEQYLRFSLLLLMDDPADGFTILEIPRVLSDAAFRKRLLAKCRNIVAKSFWEKEAEKAGGEASLANMVPYITSKFNTFIGNDYVRPIIEQSKSTLNFRRIMDDRQILLVNLSKGRLGELNASLLGMLIVGKLTLAAFSRDDMRPEDRKDFYLYIDEFQNFTTPAIATIMSEARKYRLCLTVAHQYIGQLKEPIKQAVFGNVGSLVAFRVGPDDAEYLERQFAPVFTKQNLASIENLNAHVKLIIGGQVAPAFNLFEPFPPKGDPEVARLAREYSRLTYGRSRVEVEAETLERLQS